MKPKIIIFALSFIALLSMFLYQSIRFSDGKLHLVFCDVGQGDAIFVRTPKGSDILIDGGQNDQVLDCLKKHMPFWDRTLELVFLTHPHDDHFAGFISVFKRYKVASFNTENVSNDSQNFKRFIDLLSAKKVSTRYLLAGDTFKIQDGVKIAVLGPSSTFITQTAPDGKINESEGFANIILLLKFGDFDALFTGDSQAEGLREGVGEIREIGEISGIDILQVPHHGSKTGLNREILDSLKPSLAVISVGKKNRFGHPHKDIIKLFEMNNVMYKTTARDGEVEIVSDGVKVKAAKK